jgi:hypothetical protein
MFNIGVEQFLTKLTNGNETLLMLAAFSLLVLLSFVVEMWVEIKNKDLHWNDVTLFLKPIFFNALFLLGTEIVMIPATRIPFGYESVSLIQSLGWLGAMAYYFVGFYRNLKQLGLKTSTKVDDAVNDLSIEQEEEQ